MDAIVQQIYCLGSTISCWFNVFLQFIHDAALWAPQKVFETFTNQIGSFFAALPAPAFLSDLTNNLNTVFSFSGFASFLGYMLELFQFNTGAVIILSAYAIRFAIRRLPIVG